MNEILIEKLKKLAQSKAWEDELRGGRDVVVDDFAGGNVDDAYDGGFRSGEILLARDILNDMGIEYSRKA
jgi:hypothetical protein